MSSSGRSFPTDPWNLKGCTALVTGATKGIGRAIAEELAQLGAHVWVCARTSEDLEKCLAEYASATWSGSIHGSVCDVSVAEDRKQLMAQVALRFSSKLDILVNNVGFGIISTALDLPLTSFSEVMAANLEAGLHLSQLAHPLMKANGKGSIVFNSSIAGSSVLGLQSSAYSISKGAVNQLGQDLAFEWAKDNIRVNVIAPGYTITPANQKMSIEIRGALQERIPLRRLADPSEIAHVVAFMCMPSASYITGTIITVDGGISTHLSPFACLPIESFQSGDA